jgi:gas vesicle protein
MSTGKVLLGVVAGAVAGAALGILYAPEKGTETRRKISDKSGEMKDNLRQKLNKFGDDVTRNVERVKDGANDLLEKGKSTYHEVKKDVNNPIRG